MSRPLYPSEFTSSNWWTTGYVTMCGRNHVHPNGFDPRTAQPIASHYTEYAILALRIKTKLKEKETLILNNETPHSTSPDQPWVPPNLLYNVYRYFPGVKYGRGVLLTTHPLLVPWSWKSTAIPLPKL